MQLETFIADSAVDAVEQIRAKLGAAAVVVNVRQLPARFFQKPRIEVQAHVPEPTTTGTLLDVTDEPTNSVAAVVTPAATPDAPLKGATTKADLLQSLGLSPVYAEQVWERVGATPQAWFANELKLVRAVLREMWLPCPATGRLHVFVGAPGVGKTTALCKWLTLSVLLEGRAARVWRLDGATANMAEGLSVHGDILGVPVERSWSGDAFAEDIGFVDFPGVPHTDAAAIENLARRVREFPGAQVHVVLNAAYDTNLVLAQARAFAAALPVADFIVTHLDEETRWGKLWNFILGTGCPVRYLCGGQNIPGDFFEANAERVLARVFPS